MTCHCRLHSEFYHLVSPSARAASARAPLRSCPSPLVPLLLMPPPHGTCRRRSFRRPPLRSCLTPLAGRVELSRAEPRAERSRAKPVEPSCGRFRSAVIVYIVSSCARSRLVARLERRFGMLFACMYVTSVREIRQRGAAPSARPQRTAQSRSNGPIAAKLPRVPGGPPRLYGSRL